MFPVDLDRPLRNAPAECIVSGSPQRQFTAAANSVELLSKIALAGGSIAAMLPEIVRDGGEDFASRCT
jgi:hypothetical protein